MSYDPHCQDLAELFLSDEPLLYGRAASLAQHIQNSIESWIGFERDLVVERRKVIADYLAEQRREMHKDAS